MRYALPQLTLRSSWNSFDRRHRNGAAIADLRGAQHRYVAVHHRHWLIAAHIELPGIGVVKSAAAAARTERLTDPLSVEQRLRPQRSLGVFRRLPRRMQRADQDLQQDAEAERKNDEGRNQFDQGESTLPAWCATGPSMPRMTQRGNRTMGSHYRGNSSRVIRPVSQSTLIRHSTPVIHQYRNMSARGSAIRKKRMLPEVSLVCSCAAVYKFKRIVFGNCTTPLPGA